MKIRFWILLSIYFYGTTVLVASGSRGAAAGGGGVRVLLSSVVAHTGKAEKPLVALPADGRGAQAPVLRIKEASTEGDLPLLVEGDYFNNERERLCSSVDDFTRRGVACHLGGVCGAILSKFILGETVLYDSSNPNFAWAWGAAATMGITAFCATYFVSPYTGKFKVWVSRKELQKTIATYNEAETAAEKAKDERSV